MEDLFDTLPVPYRMERLGRMRELIMQIEADYECYEALKWKIETGIGAQSDRDDLNRIVLCLKKNIIAYRWLNALSIEGITSARIGGFSALSFKQM